MRTLKPSPGVPLNTAHPLVRDSIGLWLMNEGAGQTVADCSAKRNKGTITGATWTSGRNGPALAFGGATYTYVAPTVSPYLNESYSFAAWVYLTAYPASGRYATIIGRMQGSSPFRHNYYFIVGDDKKLSFKCYTTTWTGVSSLSDVPLNKWTHVAGTKKNSAVAVYINGVLDGSGTISGTLSDTGTLAIGQCYPGTDAPVNSIWNGRLDSMLMYNRALTTGEVAQLYYEPFAMFREFGWRGFVVAGTAYRLLSGTAAAASTLSARATVCRRVRGVCTAAAGCSASLRPAGVANVTGRTEATAELTASLSVQREQQPSTTDIETRTPWRRDILFNGATSNAFQLGTALTRGWFWTRRTGCSAVYRGRSPSGVDFANSICVAGSDASQVAVPPHVRQKPGLPYWYVVRRFSSCGHVEHTTSAAVRLCLDADGKPCQPAPNPAVALAANVVFGNHVSLSWHYFPLEQEAPPDAFHVLWDGRTGRLDMSHRLATVAYGGPKLHYYQTESLKEGRYRFAVQSSSNGVSAAACPTVTIQVAEVRPQAMLILGAL